MILAVAAVGREALVSAVVGSQKRLGSHQFAATTSAVLVDVVVQDRNHRPVTNLSAEDFEIFEDGVRQRVASFEVVDLGALPTKGASTDGSTVRGAEEPDVGRRDSITALVFEELGPQARDLARSAALAFVRDQLLPGDLVGVFTLDRALHSIAPYTSDPTSLVRAIKSAAAHPGRPTEFTGQTPAAEFGGSGPAIVQDENPRIRAHSTLDGLTYLVRSLGPYHGRKSVMLFSEGLALNANRENPDDWLHDDRQAHFFHLTQEANTNNVAFYSFDARGLRTESSTSMAAAVSSPYGAAPEVGLAMLAEETAGRFIHDTNDLARGVNQVVTDLRHYYLLGYIPTRDARDGVYRAIRVKVARRDVTVLARQGYLVTRSTPGG